MTEIEVFEAEINNRLKSRLSRQDVITYWHAFAGQGRRIYQPVVDVAVGPFAVDETRYMDEYDSMVHNHRDLINEWVMLSRENWQAVIGDHYWALPPRTPTSYEDFVGNSANRNARCFIAIEVENKTSRKHLMGSIVNAGALGRIGILVVWQDKVLRATVRMREYFDYLQTVGKPTFNMNGVVILTSEQFAASLEM